MSPAVFLLLCSSRYQSYNLMLNLGELWVSKKTKEVRESTKEFSELAVRELSLYTCYTFVWFWECNKVLSINILHCI